MNLGDNKDKKIAEPFFEKNSHFAQIWPNVPKNGQFFGHCEKNSSNKLSKIAIKVGPKIVLLDGIIILHEKIRIW